MNYIAILDHDHLDHSFFMKTFAEAMSMQRGCSGIILHGDSPYTDRLIQTGMTRQDARIRSTRDLNHRIIALLADSGISAVGVNGFQKNLITRSENNINVDTAWFSLRPPGTHLVLSNLVRDSFSGEILDIPLSRLADLLREALNYEHVIVFPAEETGGVILGQSRENEPDSAGDSVTKGWSPPYDLLPPPASGFFCTLQGFAKLPDTSKLTAL
ncbi:hypothetical protein QA596_03025 [Balneolales bacterium ANBcel1]|nr:hypothetical protein [Balneolales bacterium ANBcel1]